MSSLAFVTCILSRSCPTILELENATVTLLASAFGCETMTPSAEADATSGTWSSGMIPALGAGGPEFNSRSTPFFSHPTALPTILSHPAPSLRLK